MILDQIGAGDPTEPVVLTADFNASPSALSRRRFLDSGLADSAERAGKPIRKATFHMYYGIGFQCIDGILVDRHWRVHNQLILDVKPNNIFPSDHFALLADLGLPEQAADPGDTVPEQRAAVRRREKGKK
jgi:endonuclease/exonuclease/phosphatase family metal-dependent hydrolase